MVTYQSVLTPTWTFSPLSEVVTTWQIDSAAHKLKPRSFHKSTQLWVHSVDFYPSVNHVWHFTDANCSSWSGRSSIEVAKLQMFDRAANKVSGFLIVYKCHIPNSKTCPRHVWLQYNIKSPQIFGLICVQNSVSSLVLYNGLNFTKSPQLFHFIWVKIHSHIHLYPLPNYLLQTPQIYSEFT